MFDVADLDRFHRRAAERLEAKTPDLTLFFEPNAAVRRRTGVGEVPARAGRQASDRALYDQLVAAGARPEACAGVHGVPADMVLEH